MGETGSGDELPFSETICGLWISESGEACLSLLDHENGRREIQHPFIPFAWANGLPQTGNFTEETLSGEEPYRFLLHFEHLQSYRELLKNRPDNIFVENVRALESQFLLRHQKRLYENLSFSRLRRCQCDIETACSLPDGFSNAGRKEDRVLAIGLSFSGETEPVFLVLEEMNDAAERDLLKRFNKILAEKDPDVIEGHNFFNFDLQYLRRRSSRFRLPCAWGRFGREAHFRKSRLRVAERWIDFVRCDMPGRAVIDTYLLIQQFDVTTRDMISYSLKDVAVYLGITPPQSEERTYLKAEEIQQTFSHDRERFLAYLGDDLRETAGVAGLLLPTYFAQTENFPMTLQEITLRGSANKVDLLLQETYFKARQSLPEYSEVRPFEGAFSRSFVTGVYRHVLHFDVASLYPSLLMLIGRNPASDSLGIFMPLLKKLRQARLEFKELARTAPTEELRIECQARQTAYKILINSFYGYLGFAGARFADSDLAAEVTRRGRELLRELIAEFERLGCTVLEADTDGIYLASEEYWENPDILLAKISKILPEEIELEYDGRYDSMFCYKAKNYALYDGSKITIRGSALRSRGIEPYLKELSRQLIGYLLGVEEESPLVLAEKFRTAINSRSMEISRLAKSEYLSQSPDRYKEKIEKGGKPRRASLEVALKMSPQPKMGQRVSYYIPVTDKPRLPDWQRALPLDSYDPESFPYDPAYYNKKLDAWIKRYGEHLLEEEENPQGELF